MASAATALQDSFDTTALGRQHDSKKETSPSFSFGTGSREVATKKIFVSKRHEKNKAGMISPGPVYSVSSTLGSGPKFGFGTEDQRGTHKARYPDSSVDLTCSNVDSQTIKFSSTAGVHFGTEAKMSMKNGEISRGQPTAGLCSESPGMKMVKKREFSPKEEKERILEEKLERGEMQVSKGTPAYSFGSVKGPGADTKPARGKLALYSTPRHVGPGSHAVPTGLGEQPVSARSSPPSYSFGTGQRSPRTQEQGPYFDTSPDLSSLGRQVVSGKRNESRCKFGTSTRGDKAQTAITDADRGPVATMPKLNFHYDLPPPQKYLPKAGL